MTFSADVAFNLSVKFVLADEGVLTDDQRNDPDGGLTNFGWSQKQNPDINVAALTQADAITLYKQRVWNVVRGDLLPWPLSFLLFDSAVNQGTGTAIRYLQQALLLKSDGDFGPATLKAALAREPWDLTARFCAIRLQHYVLDKEYPEDGQGWFYRVSKNLLNVGRSPVA